MRLNQRIRVRILEQSHRAHFGHIGCALCVAEILEALFDGGLQGDGGDRERFILSKGHAALALYAVLFETGRISHDELSSFCGDGTALGTHPDHAVDGVDFSTGSLGHGLSMAVGSALGARLAASGRRTFALLSDAELNEGSVWEAAMFAAHHRLGRLVAIVDANGQQALGYTRDVLALEPLGERWRAFGWSVHEVDGHDVSQLRNVFESVGEEFDRPHVVIARTTFGRGVSFMENQIAWHYWPLSDEQLATAIKEVESSAAEAVR